MVRDLGGWVKGREPGEVKQPHGEGPRVRSGRSEQQPRKCASSPGRLPEEPEPEPPGPAAPHPAVWGDERLLFPPAKFWRNSCSNREFRELAGV